MARIGKSIETEDRQVIAGAREKVKWGVNTSGYSISFWGNENVWTLGASESCELYLNKTVLYKGSFSKPSTLIAKEVQGWGAEECCKLVPPFTYFSPNPSVIRLSPPKSGNCMCLEVYAYNSINYKQETNMRGTAHFKITRLKNVFLGVISTKQPQCKRTWRHQGFELPSCFTSLLTVFPFFFLFNPRINRTYSCKNGNLKSFYLSWVCFPLSVGLPSAFHLLGILLSGCCFISPEIPRELKWTS